LRSSGQHDELDEERLFDDYLDAALRGEVHDPEAFCRERGVLGERLRQLLERLHAVLGGAAGGAEQAGARAPFLPTESGLPHERLGEYRLLRKLGEGGMGVVYLAEQESLGRLVAVKLIRQELAGSPTAAKRLQLEARAVASLRHPNIVEIHG